MLLLVFPGIGFNDQVKKVKLVVSETDCDYKLRLMCTAFIDSVIMKIRRWRYTKFAKIWALPEGPPKKISRPAIARHGGPPINLFVIPTLLYIAILHGDLLWLFN